MAILDRHCLDVLQAQGEDEKSAANPTKISRQNSQENEGLLWTSRGAHLLWQLKLLHKGIYMVFGGTGNQTTVTRKPHIMMAPKINMAASTIHPHHSTPDTKHRTQKNL